MTLFEENKTVMFYSADSNTSIINKCWDVNTQVVKPSQKGEETPFYDVR